MTESDRIVAIGLLTQRDVSLLGPAFSRIWPVDDSRSFDKMLRAIDEADARHHRSGQRVTD